MRTSIAAIVAVVLRRVGRAWRGTRIGRRHLRDDAQSMGFAIDVCRVLWQELEGSETRHLTLLDVGARTASGSGLIASVFHPASSSSLTFEVTALDVDPYWYSRAAVSHPNVTYLVGDVMDHTSIYDVVVCSHTLEHLADPGPVLEQLRSLARRLVVIAAPWRESPATRLPYHRFTFDEAFLREHPPYRFDTFHHPHWSGGPCFVACYLPERAEDASGGASSAE